MLLTSGLELSGRDCMASRRVWRLFPETPTPSLRLTVAASATAITALAAWIAFLVAGAGP